MPIPDIEPDNPEDVAEAAGLRYTTDLAPGYTRHRKGDGFVYRGLDGKRITNARILERITALALPPAWTDVWICPSPNGHLQATGRDAKGRKQYRYHDRWRSVRDETKFSRMVLFGETLPMIRAWVANDLARHGLPREKVLATVVALLDATHIRIGNQEYARENESFGLTTLLDDHVDVSGATVEFSFRGKSGKAHVVDVRDRRLARVIRQCQDLPGHQLFEYVDGDEVRAIDSDDVNQYLREITGQHFTAKDFRTWEGTLVVAHRLRSLGPASSQREATHNVAEAMKEAASVLGNTPAICRKSYVHPGIVAAYLDGSLCAARLQKERTDAESRVDLLPEEAETLALLRGLMGRETTSRAS